jgi:hypothetical protein
VLKRSVFVRALCVSLVCSVLSISAPRKAEAGIALLVAGPAALPIAAGVVTATAGAGIAIGAAWWIWHPGGTIDHDGAMGALSVFLFVLDDDASPAEQTEAALAQRYSFIEDRAVIGDLSRMIAARASEVPADENGMKLVRLSRSEITDILAPTDVMENHPEQVEQMIRDLE